MRLLLPGTLGLACIAWAGFAQTPPVQAVTVTAHGETEPVGTGQADAADDPAIWRNRSDPAASLIVGTDKKAGLYLYGLDGRARHFLPDGRLNNVALVDMGRRIGVIAVASDRNDPSHAALRLYRIDTQAGKLGPLGSVTGGPGEAYGVCAVRKGRELHAFSVLKSGAIHQVRIDLTGPEPKSAVIRTMQVATQAEGCVVDPRSRTLYVGEEDRGIWAFDARPGAPVAGKLVAPVDGSHLMADVEGLALAPAGRRGGWLIASSQGDSAYALYSLPDYKPVGRFRIADGKVGGTSETDGIDFVTGSFGPDYPAGLFVAQDGDNAPNAQNFKLVSWADIKAALQLR